MPYPESCPECGSQFRNTGTHFTARRNEVGRHVLLELGCQNTHRRYWWDFTAGQLTEDEASPASRAAVTTAPRQNADESNGHVALSTLNLTAAAPPPEEPEPMSVEPVLISELE